MEFYNLKEIMKSIETILYHLNHQGIPICVKFVKIQINVELLKFVF